MRRCVAVLFFGGDYRCICIVRRTLMFVLEHLSWHCIIIQCHDAHTPRWFSLASQTATFVKPLAGAPSSAMRSRSRSMSSLVYRGRRNVLKHVDAVGSLHLSQPISGGVPVHATSTRGHQPLQPVLIAIIAIVKRAAGICVRALLSLTRGTEPIPPPKTKRICLGWFPSDLGLFGVFEHGCARVRTLC